MSYDFRFNVVETVTSALQGIGKGFEHATQLADTFVGTTNKAPRIIEDIQDEARELERQLERTFDEEEARELGKEIKRNEREMHELRRETDRTERSMKGLELSGFGVSRVVGSIGAALAGLGLGMVVTDGIIMQSQFEATEVALGNAIGSLDIAKGAIREITELAAMTPFGIQELQEGYAKLVNSGFRPVREELIALGDIAAAQKKPFEQLVEAVLDAGRGQGERLLDLGMSMSVMGDKVAISYGDKIKKIVPKTEAAIREAIVSFGRLEGVSGVMEAVSASTAGLLSNLADKWSLTKLAIGEAFRPLLVEFAPMAKTAMAGLVDWISRFAGWVVVNKDQLVNLAVTGVAGLQALAAWVGVLVGGWAIYRTYMLAVAAAQGIGTAAVWIHQKALKAATIAEGAYLFVTDGLARSMLIATAQAWLMNTALFANPIGGIVIGVLAAIAVITALAYHFEGFREFLFKWGGLLLEYSPFGFLYKAIDYLFPTLTATAGEELQVVMDWFKKAWDFIYSTFIEPFTSFIGAFTDLSFDITATPKIGDPEGDLPKGDKTALEMVNALGKGGTGGSIASSIGSMSAGGSGGGPKNITIHIDRLIEHFTVNAASMEESAADIKEKVIRILLDATNEANVQLS